LKDLVSFVCNDHVCSGNVAASVTTPDLIRCPDLTENIVTSVSGSNVCCTDQSSDNSTVVPFVYLFPTIYKIKYLSEIIRRLNRRVYVCFKKRDTKTEADKDTETTRQKIESGETILKEGKKQ